MVTLKDIGDTLQLLIIAGVAGMLGGFVGDLVTARGAAKELGAVEKPKWITARYFDLGSWAAAPIGLVNAIIATWLFSSVEVDGGVRTYAIERLLAVSLIAGAVGPAFLQTSARRMLAEMDTERMKSALVTAREVAINGTTDAANAAPAAVTAETAAIGAKANANATLAAIDAALKAGTRSN